MNWNLHKMITLFPLNVFWTISLLLYTGVQCIREPKTLVPYCWLGQNMLQSRLLISELWAPKNVSKAHFRRHASAVYGRSTAPESNF